MNSHSHSRGSLGRVLFFVDKARGDKQTGSGVHCFLRATVGGGPGDQAQRQGNESNQQK